MDNINQTIDEDNLSSLGVNEKDKAKAKILDKAIDYVFSTDDEKLVQVTEIRYHELPSAIALEWLWHFVVKRYCFNPIIRNNIRKAMNKVYMLRNSLGRERETKLFDIFKESTIVPYNLAKQDTKKWI